MHIENRAKVVRLNYLLKLAHLNSMKTSLIQRLD